LDADRRFDPLRLDLLSQNLRKALEGSERIPFLPPERFVGAGLYALYYIGGLPRYETLRDQDVPIYVGKAEAGNSNYGDPLSNTTRKLYQRIAMHARSVQEVAAGGGDLAVGDFEIKYLLLDDVWIVLGERALLRAYAPVAWNALMSGFGANSPGVARRNGRSVWDTIHMGRSRAGDICNRLFTRAEMEDHLRVGLEISAMPAGPDRDRELQKLRSRMTNKLWALPRRDAPDQRLRVFRVDAFLEENAAIGASIADEDWIDATGDSNEEEPDPEEATDLNTLAPEPSENEDEG
jgi:hypothetical protein